MAMSASPILKMDRCKLYNWNVAPSASVKQQKHPASCMSLFVWQH